MELNFVSNKGRNETAMSRAAVETALETRMTDAVVSALPKRMQNAVLELFAEEKGIEELRFRVNSPVQAVMGTAREKLLFEDSPFTLGEAEELLENICAHSVYAKETELAGGFVSLENGIRVGVSGAPLFTSGVIGNLTAVTSFNFRFPREVKGCARRFLGRVFAGRDPYSLIVAAPPREGKTTFLRDAARCLSDGIGVKRPYKIALADERGELSGGMRGVAALDVGKRTDIMCGVPKTLSIPLLLRSMSPEVIITDELASSAEMRALYEAAKYGAAVLASVHAGSPEDVLKKPWLKRAVENGDIAAFFLKRQMGESRLYEILPSKRSTAHSEKLC
ncbi:MAG: hypothetical protein IKS90_00920 [Clostridia bacterium]|nr:hypothetical protein [Clostridia bacterium]